MSPKIFLTGATGYIGGSVLHALVTAHPSYTITVLLRKTPPSFPSVYPNVKIVQGDYDSAEILAEQARKADIVVHNGDSDHEPSLTALLAGLTSKPTPSYLLHLSGTGILSDWASPAHLGTLNPKVYSDADPTDIATLASLPDDALHRGTEKLLFRAAAAHGEKVRIAIMCPPDIYGRGTGLGNTQSVFVRMFIADVRGAGNRPFYYGEGANARSWVHVEDLMKLYVRVVEAAVDNETSFSGPGEFPGYYFAGTQEHRHIDVARGIGRVLEREGVVADAEPVEVGLEVIDGMARHPRFPQLGRYLYASNSRTRAVRAGKAFGYKGEAPGLMESLEGDVLAALGR
ncbi:hypothetical protein SLS60_011540 [Paraconiothyrium brasiliense]|uniref:Nucleoside-diphosphate-sugar epimerase n=1 Tax=Paraconiothyrium brasiliense TaxID=300254 RepID=A0ABR3QJ10_9PLEO